MYQGEIVLKKVFDERDGMIDSYNIVEDKLGITLKDFITYKSVLKLLSDGVVIEFVDENNNSLYVLEKRKELLSKQSSEKDVFKFLDILNTSKSRYSIFRNVSDERENILYTIIKLPYDYISFYFSEETGNLIKIQNERNLQNVIRCN